MNGGDYNGPLGPLPSFPNKAWEAPAGKTGGCTDGADQWMPCGTCGTCGQTGGCTDRSGQWKKAGESWEDCDECGNCTELVSNTL